MYLCVDVCCLYCSGVLRYVFFFFKQKTAYEMRISDWSSDVCSSDLCMSDTLAFMIADTSRLLRRSFDERTRVIGITGAQWRLLLTVSRNEGQNQDRKSVV